MKKFYASIYMFVFGAVLYSLIEIVFRGYTHWTMTLTGGAVFLIIYSFNKRMSGTSLLLRCAAGSAVITAIEFAVGCVVNLWLKMDVWDYSDKPFNLLGQVCPLFSVIWFFLCIPAIGISLYIGKKLGFISAFGKVSGDTVDSGGRKAVLMRRILQNLTFRNI